MREHGSVAGWGVQGRGWGEGVATTRPAAVRERHRPETSGTKWESGAEHRTPKRLQPRGMGSFLTTRDNLFGIGRFGGVGAVDHCSIPGLQPTRGPQGRYGVRRFAALSFTHWHGWEVQPGARPACRERGMRRLCNAGIGDQASGLLFWSIGFA
jgi:hypothetical protein